MFYDLSPMRPDEFGRQRARRWTEAMQCRVAAQEGIEQARNEAKRLSGDAGEVG